MGTSSRGSGLSRGGTDLPSSSLERASASRFMVLRQCWPNKASNPSCSTRRANSAASKLAFGLGDASLTATLRADSLSSWAVMPRRQFLMRSPQMMIEMRRASSS